MGYKNESHHSQQYRSIDVVCTEQEGTCSYITLQLAEFGYGFTAVHDCHWPGGTQQQPACCLQLQHPTAWLARQQQPAFLHFSISTHCLQLHGLVNVESCNPVKYM